jgi:3-phytase
MRRGKRSVVAFAAAVIVAAAGVVPASASDGAKPPGLTFLGQAIVPTGTTFAGTTVGGLSSITYDAARSVFYSLSDDQSQLNPARFYTLRVDLSDGRLDDGDVSFLGVTTLLAPDGQPYAPFSLDPEGLTLAKAGELVVTSEGIAARGISPWVRRYALDGAFAGDLPVPAAFQPTSATHGVRQNLAFEAAAVAPNGRHLFVGMEGALAQDGPAASLTGGSPARILRYNLATGRLDRQNVYLTDAIAESPVPETAFAVNGLVELLPLNDEFMLSMERSFSVGAPGTGNTIKLYSVAFPEADDVDGADSVAAELGSIRPVQKSLLLDLRTLGIPLDNVEGMAIGPTLPDGRRSLLLVSDNNFAATQFTQFLLFALD